MPRNLELHRGSLYIYFEDYHGSGPVNSLAAQLHDQDHLSGTYGYLIHPPKCQTDIILAYQPNQENNMLTLLDNQNRASEQFPESEPRVTRPIHANELHLVERILAWGELDAEHSLLTATRAQWQREYFRDHPSGKELPKGWSLNILGLCQDGREELYCHLEFKMGVILPQIQPVMANFMEGCKVAYPKGSKFIIMRQYWFAALDFLRGISLYLQDQEC